MTDLAGGWYQGIKLGGCLRYRRANLNAWVAEHLEAVDDDQRRVPRPATSR